MLRLLSIIFVPFTLDAARLIKRKKPTGHLATAAEMIEDYVVKDAEVEGSSWGLERISADSRSRSGAGATIFVFDTGVRTTHMDFTNRATPALDMTSGSPRECNGDLNCAADRQGLGTHLAGTAVGKTYGVAPGAKLQSVKVISDWGFGTCAWSRFALNWVVESSVRPAVVLLEAGVAGGCTSMAGAIQDAIDAGVVVVTSAKWWSADCSSPPPYPMAINAAGIDRADRPSITCGGDIWAPEMDITSLSRRSDTATATSWSFGPAAAHVAGAAALVLDAEPSMAQAKVLATLLRNAEKLGDDRSLLNVSGL